MIKGPEQRKLLYLDLKNLFQNEKIIDFYQESDTGQGMFEVEMKKISLNEITDMMNAKEREEYTHFKEKYAQYESIVNFCDKFFIKSEKIKEELDKDHVYYGNKLLRDNLQKFTNDLNENQVKKIDEFKSIFFDLFRLHFEDKKSNEPIVRFEDFTKNSYQFMVDHAIESYKAIYT